MNIKERVIKQIEDNKISTTEVADILGKSGNIPNVLPINPKMHKVGEVVFIYAYNKSNWEVHQQIANIPENKIVYVHGIDCGDKAIFGDLVSKYLLLYKRAKAIVVNGLVRDAHTLIKESYPVWAKGVTPIGCNNLKNEVLPSEETINELKNIYDGSIMICDDSGVVFIEKEKITEDIISKLEFIELQEDVWYFCMDAHKMSTYEIVCEKKYLKEDGLIDKNKLEALSTFSTAK